MISNSFEDSSILSKLDFDSIINGFKPFVFTAPFKGIPSTNFKIVSDFNFSIKVFMFSVKSNFCIRFFLNARQLIYIRNFYPLILLFSLAMRKLGIFYYSLKIQNNTIKTYNFLT